MTHTRQQDQYAELPDHAAAAAEVLERYAGLIRAGGNVEDVAVQLLPVVRIMARRT